MTPFVTPDGLCRVLMPGVPQYKTQQMQTKSNGTLVEQEYYVNLENDHKGLYMVKYVDIPNLANFTPEQALLDGRDGDMKGPDLSPRNRTMLADAPISVNGVPGRAYTIFDADTKVTIVTHAFVAGNRHYEFDVVFVGDHSVPYSDSFLNSVSLSRPSQN